MTIPQKEPKGHRITNASNITFPKLLKSTKTIKDFYYIWYLVSMRTGRHLSGQCCGYYHFSDKSKICQNPYFYNKLLSPTGAIIGVFIEPGFSIHNLLFFFTNPNNKRKYKKKIPDIPPPTHPQQPSIHRSPAAHCTALHCKLTVQPRSGHHMKHVQRHLTLRHSTAGREPANPHKDLR